MLVLSVLPAVPAPNAVAGTNAGIGQLKVQLMSLGLEQLELLRVCLEIAGLHRAQ